MEIKILVFFIISLAVTKFVSGQDEANFRLPSDTRPMHYRVQLTTDIDRGDFNFSGIVNIRLQALANTSEITLHYRQITIENINLFYAGNATPVLIESNIVHSLDEQREWVIIPIAEELEIYEQYILEITYNGILRTDNAGFYRSSYRDSEGIVHWQASTQFQSTDARHGFPCYDEPGIRARYSIEITHNANYSAVSNMPVLAIGADPDSPYVTTMFQMTPLMQSYLVAFIVSDLGSLDNNDVVQQRVIARRESIELGEAVMALQVGEETLEIMERHLNMTYNLPKLDQVAVPDFQWGAMENWGMCVYREEFFLFNEELGTRRQRVSLVSIIAHEYIHNWFGNLLGPLWWDFLWLNEGFAALYERFIPGLLYPEERHMDLFVLYYVQESFEVDSNPNVRAMTNDAQTPAQILGAFDGISYGKAGSVLRMFQVAFTESTWLKGVQNYIAGNEYNSVTSADFYAGLQQATNEDWPNPWNVTAIFETWEHQGGFPLVTVTRDGGELTFTQRRFFFSDLESDALWWVPISYTTRSEADFTASHHFWMDERSVTISNETEWLTSWQEDDWIVVNLQQSGYYRVNYDEHNWQLLTEQLRSEDFGEIPVLNRAQLVDDSLNLARAGIIPYSTAFGVLEYLQRDFDYVPWSAANRDLTVLTRWLSGTTAFESYQALVRRTVEPLFDHYGFEVIADEPILNRFARTIAINLACQTGIESCLTQTADILQAVVNNETSISPDVQAAIYCNGLRQLDSSAYNFLLDVMLQSDYAAERTILQNALGCANNVEDLSDYLQLAAHPDSNLRRIERVRIFNTPVNSGDLGLRVMMDFIRVPENFEAVNNVQQGFTNAMISTIAIRIVADEMMEEFEAFLVDMQGAELITEGQANNWRDNVNENFAWRERFAEEIENALNV